MLELFSYFFRNKTPSQILSYSKLIGTFLYNYFPYRKNVIQKNIKILLKFKGETEEELSDLTLANYQNIAALFLEGFKLQHVSEIELKNIMKFDPESDLKSKLSAEKKAVILLGHLGNWEFMATGLGLLLNEPVYFVTKKLTNPFFNKYMHTMREKFSNRMIPMEYSRDVLNRQLMLGHKIAMAGDQSAHVESYWDNFLGVPAPVFLGAASFALKNNAPLYLLVPIRQDDGKFIIYGEHIKSDDLDSTKKESLYELTHRHITVLEKYIVKFPEQYYWIHKRWKHSEKVSQYFHLYHKS